MESVAVSAIAVVMLVMKGLITFVIVYVAARLAIRHERRG